MPIANAKLPIPPKWTNQNGRSQIKFVKELGDKDVDFEDILLVKCLHLLQHIHKPFKILVSWTNPEEIYLLKYNKLIAKISLRLSLYGI